MVLNLICFCPSKILNEQSVSLIHICTSLYVIRWSSDSFAKNLIPCLCIFYWFLLWKNIFFLVMFNVKLQSDYCISVGRFLGELTKEVFSDLAASKYQVLPLFPTNTFYLCRSIPWTRRQNFEHLSITVIWWMIFYKFALNILLNFMRSYM